MTLSGLPSSEGLGTPGAEQVPPGAEPLLPVLVCAAPRPLPDGSASFITMARLAGMLREFWLRVIMPCACWGVGVTEAGLAPPCCAPRELMEAARG